MAVTYTSDLDALPTFAYDQQPTASQFNALADALRWVNSATDDAPQMEALQEAGTWLLPGGTDGTTRVLNDLVIIHKMPFLIYQTWDTEDAQYEDIEQPVLQPISPGLEDVSVSLGESIDKFTTVDLSRYDWMTDGTIYRLKNVRFAGEFMIPFVEADD